MIRGSAIAWLLALATGILAAAQRETAPSASPSSASSSARSAAVIVLQGQIDDYSRDALMRNFKAARAAAASTIILQIDTYGGLVTAGLDISRFLKNQSDLHTIAYVD